MIIAFAGLPGSGKSYFAEWIAKRHPSFVVLDKDIVRSSLFPGDMTDYTSEQDDFCIDVILRAAKYLLAHHGDCHVIVDGRTFTRNYQVRQVMEAAQEMHVPCLFVDFVCDDESIRKRIEEQKATHHAKNRDFSLYLDLKAKAEPLTVPHLTLESDGSQTLEEREEEFLRYVETGKCVGGA